MDYYDLQPNESLLYKSSGRLVNKNEKYLESLSTNTNTELILTNLHLIMIKKSKKLFAKEQVEHEIYPVGEIKVYNETPQIKQDNTRVEIFLISGEKVIDLFSKHEVRKFINKAYDLLTGKSTAVRGAGKVKGAVNLVDNALGINTVNTIKNVVENGVVSSVLGKGMRDKVKNSNVLTDVLNTTKDLMGKKVGDTESPQPEKDSTVPFENQIETLKKLKELLDTGIISQEEFDAKKKQILGLGEL